jgi:anti-sigma factor RsiW
MTCRELAELLLEYVEGSLDPHRAGEVRTHLDRCPPCVRYVETYQLTIRLGRRLPPAPAPARLIQRVEQALQSRTPPAGLPPA